MDFIMWGWYDFQLGGGVADVRLGVFLDLLYGAYCARNIHKSVDRDAFKASSSVAVSSYNFGCGVSRGCARCLCAAEAYAQELVANCFAFHRPVGQVSRLAR